MSAVLAAREPSAKYLATLQAPLVQHFDLLATAPCGVARLRELILTLAVQGKLVPQDPNDQPASVLLEKIRAEKDRLIAVGKMKREKPVDLTDSEMPFELPSEWKWASCAEYFNELCTGPFGSIVHQQDYVHDGVPLINPSHMVEGRIVHDPRITLNAQKAQQLYFLELIGCNVNLGNIAPSEVIALEAMRIGLRGDTFDLYLNKETA